MSGYSQAGRSTNALLDERKVRELRLADAQAKKLGYRGIDARHYARQYGVSVEAVRRVLRFDSWAWVSLEGEGATPEQWAAPPSPEEVKAAGESLQRVQDILGKEDEA